MIGRFWLAAVALALSCGLAPGLAAAAGTIYVDCTNTTGIEDGTPDHPYNTIREGIVAALPGDTVLALPCIYGERIDFLGKAITVSSTNPFDPAVVAATIIDGGGSGSVVTFATGEGPDSVLQGFTIRNGSGTRVGQLDHGGGIICRESSPTISNNVITANTTGGYGNGGGIACVPGSTSPYVPSSPVIADNTITGNSGARGGGIYCTKDSEPTIANNIISDNEAGRLGIEGYGGGIYCHLASPVIAGNIISGNSGGLGGGGIRCGSWSSPALVNNVIVGNTAGLFGGGVHCWTGCSPTVTNCTIADNVAPRGSGIDTGESSPVALTNCIVWDAVYSDAGSPITATYSDLCSAPGVPWTGEGNICGDPQFLDPASGDYHLSVDSPCIDAGTSQGAPALDIDGDARPAGGRVDMGADERVPGPPLCLQLQGSCWYMITFPCQAMNPDPWEVLDELRPPTKPLDMLSGNLHRYDADTRAYVTYHRWAPTEFGPLTPGDGYWLWLFQDDRICYEAQCTLAPAHVRFPTAGWHLIGYPSLSDTYLDYTLWYQGPEGPHSFSEILDQWVQDPLFGYSCQLNRYTHTGLLPTDEDAYLHPFQAYWVHTFVDDVTAEFIPP